MDQQNVESYSPISQAEMDLNAPKLFGEIGYACNLSPSGRNLLTTRVNVSHRLQASVFSLGVQHARRIPRPD